jgi:hypothetical protein
MAMHLTSSTLPRRKVLRLGALVCATAGLFACSFGKPDITTVPDHPSFATDVTPLLVDHCLLCHGYPAKRDAPGSFRLDVYDDTIVPGAHSEADRFVRSVIDGKMPPAAAWGDGVGSNGKKLLQNWLADGAPP